MKNIIYIVLFSFSSFLFAKTVSIDMKDLKTGQSVGIIQAAQTQYGVVFKPNLSKLTMGFHGFHMHQNASCDSIVKEGKSILGGAAGGHYDPQKTNKHGLPWGNNNHLGDFPALYVNSNGIANRSVLAPRIKLMDLSGRSFMIHSGGDNHSDTPHALGGGGSRVICGVVN
jgi:Cu-Zn family superoxide dismutase